MKSDVVFYLFLEGCSNRARELIACAIARDSTSILRRKNAKLKVGEIAVCGNGSENIGVFFLRVTFSFLLLFFRQSLILFRRREIKITRNTLVSLFSSALPHFF